MTEDDEDLADEADVRSVKETAPQAQWPPPGWVWHPEPPAPPPPPSHLPWIVAAGLFVVAGGLGVVALGATSEATKAKTERDEYESEAADESARADEAEQRLADCRGERRTPRKPRTPAR